MTPIPIVSNLNSPFAFELGLTHPILMLFGKSVTQTRVSVPVGPPMPLEVLKRLPNGSDPTVRQTGDRTPIQALRGLATKIFLAFKTTGGRAVDKFLIYRLARLGILSQAAGRTGSWILYNSSREQWYLANWRKLCRTNRVDQEPPYRAIDKPEFPANMSFAAIAVLLLTCSLSAAVPCTLSSSPESVVEEQMEAYNKHDLSRFLECYSADITIDDLSGSKPQIRGLNALKSSYDFLKRMPASFGVHLLNRVVRGCLVIDTYRLSGALEHSESMPDSVSVFQVRNRLITKIWLLPTK